MDFRRMQKHAAKISVCITTDSKRKILNNVVRIRYVEYTFIWEIIDVRRKCS